MKSYRSLPAAVVILVAASISGCRNAKAGHPDGWYLITDGVIADRPIVKVEDFDTIELVSFPCEDGETYQIAGRLKADKADLWAKATEEASGEIVGFVFDGEVVSAPRINCRIESGNFVIFQPPSDGAHERLQAIYNSLRERMGIADTDDETYCDLSGSYKGTLPAADASGIAVTLVLNPNGTYTMNMDYIGRDAVFDEQGAFRIDRDKLVLTNESGNATLFAIEDGRLRMLDADGRAAVGALADNYLLYRQ